jgi:RNA polymerase sigma-70 factor, ECF subfamily
MAKNGMIQVRRSESRMAFLDLIKRVEPSLLAFVRQQMRSAFHADDIVQQTFLRAWSHADFDPGRVDARGYLFTIALNLVADWMRDNENKSESLDALSERGSLFPSTVDRQAHDPLARMIAQERREDLRTALARLDPDDREILDRFYLRQEGTQFQIASAMGLSVAAFNSRLNRARIELKRRLRPGSSPDGHTKSER